MPRTRILAAGTLTAGTPATGTLAASVVAALLGACGGVPALSCPQVYATDQREAWEAARSHLIVDGEDLFACDCDTRREVISTLEGRELGGAVEERDLGDTSEGRRLGGETEERLIAAAMLARTVIVTVEGRELGGQTEGRTAGGDLEDRGLGGERRAAPLTCRAPEPADRCDGAYYFVQGRRQVRYFDGISVVDSRSGCVPLRIWDSHAVSRPSDGPMSVPQEPPLQSSPPEAAPVDASEPTTPEEGESTTPEEGEPTITGT